MTVDPRPTRTPSERLADHAAIERLTDELLPALVARLSASGLGEIEVGEDEWTVRVRRPLDSTLGQPRRSSDKASRSQPGHAGHGHAPSGFEGHRGSREGKPGAVLASSSNGSGQGSADVRTAAAGSRTGDDAGSDLHRTVATSPAVGVFQPKTDLKPGSRVRNGDRLGAVDMLGIAQEVVAPADGIVGASLVEAGQAVEYGQDLIVIELVVRPAERSEA